MRIEFVSPEGDINPENDNVDVHLYLDDGRVYSFLVATPNNIYACMDNEEIDYFFSFPPVLFVRTLDRESVERAIVAVLEERKWLDIYGVMQTTDEES